MKHDADVGKLTLRKYVNAKSQTKQHDADKRIQKEKQFLSRYKEPKSSPTKSSNLKHDADVGKLTLRKYVNAKRQTKQQEIKEYEKQFLSRYKEPKSSPTKSSNLKHDADVGKLTLRQYVNAKRQTKQQEIKEYEKQFLSRYKEPKSDTKKSISHLDIPKELKRDIKKEIKEYEKKYLV